MTPSQRERLDRVEAARREPGTMVTCPECQTGHLHVTNDGIGDRCDTCEYDDTICSCGARMVFDATSRGTTCGGLDLVGWRHCPVCPDPVHEVCHISQPADAVEWRLSKGGRSLTAGGVKVRAEAQPGYDTEGLMARIVRVPELELEVEQLRAQLARRANLSESATGGHGAGEVCRG